MELHKHSAAEKLEMVYAWYSEKEPESFNLNFIDSLYEALEEYGSLTERQEKALNTILLTWVFNDD